jgi:hypothetical protein
MSPPPTSPIQYKLSATPPPDRRGNNRAPAAKPRWTDKLLRYRYLVGAALFHLIIFLLVGTLVIWKAAPQQVDADFHGVTVKLPPPPPPEPPASGGEARNPTMEPDPVVVPVVTPVTAITTEKSSFTVDTAKALTQALSHMTVQAPQGAGLSSGAGGASGNGNFSSAFGAGSGNGFAGDLYDLKQTPDQKPNKIANNPFEQAHPGDTAPGWANSPSTREEIRVLRNYVVGFDDRILEDYFHAPAPLFAPQIFIPELSAAEAPKAFGVEKMVQPRRWIVVYKARIIPPVTGDFRFVGFADDYMVVRMDEQNVLDACWTPGELAPGIDANEDVGPAPEYTRDYGGRQLPLVCGPWIHMDAGIKMNMKLLIGEGPGGQSAFFLFIQQKGVNYPRGDYPVFQVSDQPLPTTSNRKTVPPAFSGKKMVFGLAPD